MKISALFDSGSIEVVDLNRNDHIQLKIRRDSHSDFLQWFYFRLTDAANQDCRIHLTNASEASYAQGWPGYRAVASYDRKHWFRVSTHFDGKELVIDHTPLSNCIYYAFFEPYPYEKHLDLIGRVAESGWCDLTILGRTVDGRDLEMLAIGDQLPTKPKIWVIARQHPGESMAEWFVDGLLERLLDDSDALARTLLQRATFYIVPNMNPDGVVRGNLRTNAAGANLNREWLAPSVERSPEVFYVRQKMQKTGVNLFLDIHGDEVLPYVFVAGCEGNPNYSEGIKHLEDDFKRHFMLANPDFQDSYGYEKNKPGEADLSMATHYVGQQFGCLAFTLEMPFKDNANLPDSAFGWNGDRSKKLGASILQPIWALLPSLT